MAKIAIGTGVGANRHGRRRKTSPLQTAPVVVLAPTLEGSARIGEPLEVSAGTWAGYPTPTLARRWQCDGADIPDATGANYTPVAGDDGAQVRCVVTASNSVAATEAPTAAVGVVYAPPVYGGGLADGSFGRNVAIPQYDIKPFFSGENLMFNAVNLPDGLSLDNGVISGTPRTVQVSAVIISAANSGGGDQGRFNIVVFDAVGAPDAFAEEQWSVMSSGSVSGDEISINLSALPADGGAALTRIEYRLDSGNWTDLGAAAPGSREVGGLIPGAPVTVELRAVNAIGAGPAGAAKSVTPRHAAPVYGGGLVDLEAGQGVAIAPYDVRGFFEGAGLAFNAIGLPEGLKIADGVITGAPAEAQVSSITIVAANSGGAVEGVFGIAIAATVGVPSGFAAGAWGVVSADAADGDTINIAVTGLPDDGGAALTRIDYRIDGGTWTTLGAALPGIHEVNGLIPGAPVTVELRAINAIGAGPVGAAKSVTPRHSAPAVVTTGTVVGGVIGGAWTVEGFTSSGTGALSFRWTRNGVDIPGATGESYTPLAADDGTELARVATVTNSGGADSAVTPGRRVTYAPPAASAKLADRNYALGSGAQTVNAAAGFMVPGDPDLSGVTWSVDGADATIDGAGVVSLLTTDPRAGAVVTVTAANSGGAASSAFLLTVAAVVGADLTIEFGALTGAGDGGAQARGLSGAPIDFTAITAQDAADRWEVSGGRMVWTGNDAITDETVAAMTAEGPVMVEIAAVPNAISVATQAEFAALDKSLSTPGRPDATVLLRAGCTGAKAQTAEFGGSGAGSKRVLHGTLTIRGERVNGAPAAILEGWRGMYTTGGAIHLRDLAFFAPPGERRPGTHAQGDPVVLIAGQKTTQVHFYDCDILGDPEVLEWPGRTANNGGSDWGIDPWSATLRITLNSGSITEQGFGNAHQTITANGRSRAIIGCRRISGSTYEINVCDQGGKAYWINDKLGGEGLAGNLSGSFSTSGGASGVIQSPPGGKRQYSGNAYSDIVKGPRCIDYIDGMEVCHTLILHGCRIRGGDSLCRPMAHEEVVVEECEIAFFTQDGLKTFGIDDTDSSATKSQKYTIRRNDFHHVMESASDLGAPHADMWQYIFGKFDNECEVYHNRVLCNGRGYAQGMFLSPNISLVNSVFAGNIIAIKQGSNATLWNCKRDTAIFNNSMLEIYPGTANSPYQNNAPHRPAVTGTASGLHHERNVLHKSFAVPTQFGSNADQINGQDGLYEGLGGSNPFDIQDFDDLMIAAKTNQSLGANLGAIHDGTDWSQYPKYVPTDFPGLSFAPPALDPGAVDEVDPDDGGVPRLSSPEAERSGGGYTGSVTTDTGSGVLYWVVGASPVAPDAASVREGRLHAGDVALASGSQPVLTAGAQTISGYGLSGEAIRYVHFVQISDAGASAVAGPAEIAADAATGGAGIGVWPDVNGFTDNRDGSVSLQATINSQRNTTLDKNGTEWPNGVRRTFSVRIAAIAPGAATGTLRVRYRALTSDGNLTGPFINGPALSVTAARVGDVLSVSGAPGGAHGARLFLEYSAGNFAPEAVQATFDSFALEDSA